MKLRQAGIFLVQNGKSAVRGWLAQRPGMNWAQLPHRPARSMLIEVFQAFNVGRASLTEVNTIVLAALSYYDSECIALHEATKPCQWKDLGPFNFLIRRKGGLLTVVATIADSVLGMHSIDTTCQIQLSGRDGYELIAGRPNIADCVTHASRVQKRGTGETFGWSALLRQFERTNPAYNT